MFNIDKVKTWLFDLSKTYNENKIYLSELDSPIGDGDHGVNLSRGFDAVVTQWEKTPPADLGSAFKLVSMALIKTVGGASGPLYGTFFMKGGLVLTNKQEAGLNEWIEIVEKGIAGIEMMGKAQKGDKTMLDAWHPALDALKKSQSEGKTFDEALKESAVAAEEGMKATIPLLAKKGRASYLGERSIGHQDPGATSVTMLLKGASIAFGN